MPRDQDAGEDCSAVFLTLSASDNDLAAIKVNIGYAQLERLKQAQSASIHERADQPDETMDMGQDISHLVPSQDDWDMDWALGVDQVSLPFKAAAKDLLKEEQEGGQGLVLGPSTDLAVVGQVRKKVAHVGPGHGFRVALAVKQDEPANPCDVGLFGARAVVTRAQVGAHAVEQTRWRGRSSATLTGFRPHKGNDDGTVASILVVLVHGRITLRRPCRLRSTRGLAMTVVRRPSLAWPSRDGPWRFTQTGLNCPLPAGKGPENPARTFAQNRVTLPLRLPHSYLMPPIASCWLGA